MTSIKDVARDVEMSTATVSRALRGLQGVSDETRERVMESARRLGYVPSPSAAGLASGHTRTVAVIVPRVTQWFFAAIVQGAEEVLRERGYDLLLYNLAGDATARHRVFETSLLTKRVDAVLVLSLKPSPDELGRLSSLGRPVTIVGADMPGWATVRIDDHEAAATATQHLLDLGHGTVFHVAGPESSFSAARRTESWRSTLVAAGATVLPPVVGDWTVESGYRIGMALDPAVTAVFAANDQMALGLMRALHERGLSIPGDVSVVGFDDMGEAQAFWPPLTTVHQDFAEIGRRSIQALLHEIEDASRDVGTTIVPTRLVVRESTGRPRS